MEHAKDQNSPQTLERGTHGPAPQAHHRQGLKPGDPLLTEQEMVERFGVSRSVVREATKALDFLGIINAVPRRGMVLDDFDFDRVSEYFGFHFALSDYPREKLLKARVVIETGALFYTMEEMKKNPALYPQLRRLAEAAPKTETRPISGGSSTTSPFIGGWSRRATSRRWPRSATCFRRSSTSSARRCAALWAAWSITARLSRLFIWEIWMRPSTCCGVTCAATGRRKHHGHVNP